MVDQCIRLLSADGHTRVSSVLLTDAVREARRRHATSNMATVALGRAMVTGALLGSTVREQGRVNLQFVGNGPIGALVVDAHGDGSLRAYVRRPLVSMATGAGRVHVAPAVGREGFLHVLLDPSGGQFSRASVELVNGEIDDDVASYLHNSAQVPSAIGADVLMGSEDITLAAGLLVQVLPGGTNQLVDAARQTLENGGIQQLLLDDPPATAEALANRLFPGEKLTVLDERVWRWQCTCSRERVLSAISTLGVQEVTTILDEDGKVDATCHFCNEPYLLTREDLTALLAEMQASTRGGPEVA